MSRQLPDLFEGCYDGEHRKLLAPEQFKQMFCEVCLNPGCRNSRGAGSRWSQRMLTQEDRLLRNPDFAPDNTAEVMGLPDFKSMLQEALRIEISTRRNDWEPVTDAEVGRAAAEMMGIMPSSPSGFQGTMEVPEVKEPPPVKEEPEEVEGRWRVRGDSKDEKGEHRTYTVTLHRDGSWDCSCPSNTKPCKHVKYIEGRINSVPNPVPVVHEDPIAPPPVPNRRPVITPQNFNTVQPQSGIMIGGPAPAPEEPGDPWAAPAVKERKIGVGGKVTFGGNKT